MSLGERLSKKVALVPREWRQRSELSRRPAWSVMALLVVAIAAILLAVGWRATRGDAVESAAAQTMATAAAGDSANHQLEESRSEVAGLRQDMNDLNQQVHQGTVALITANDKVQSLQGELAVAQQKITSANSDRESIRQQLAELKDELRKESQALSDVCRTLRSEKDSAGRPHESSALAAACQTKRP